MITYYEALVGDPGAARRELLGQGKEALQARVLTNLEALHPQLRAQVKSVALHRWGHAMIRPVPGLLFGPALRQARTPLGNVLACSTDTRGVALFEEAFYAGLGAGQFALRRGGRSYEDMSRGEAPT